MTSDVLGTFESALQQVDVRLERTTVATFRETVATVLESPAVGVPLPFDGVSLPEDVVIEPTRSQLEAAATGVTAVDCAIADYGSVVIRSSPAGEEPVSLYAETHVAVVAASDVLPDMAAAFERFGDVARDERADLVIATGPSATADMGSLVKGAHGPKAVHVVVIEDR